MALSGSGGDTASEMLVKNATGCNNIILFMDILDTAHEVGRSHWSRRLRHELSTTAVTLASWVRISLKAWMSAIILCLC
jgi:hypothetical protein